LVVDGDGSVVCRLEAGEKEVGPALQFVSRCESLNRGESWD
jgi:hypothetical protein